MTVEDNNSTNVEIVENNPQDPNLSGDPVEPKYRIEQPVPVEAEKLRKIFVGGLVANSTDESLREFYSQFGDITDVIVMRDPNTRRSRGFGFVSFTTKSMVDAAMAHRPHVIDGKTVDAKRAVPKDEKSGSESNFSTSRLYVSGVREDHTERMFSEYFRQFGNVINAEIIRDRSTGKPRGFAFISFDDYDAVDQCVLQKSHMINNQRCDVKKGLKKDEIPKAQAQRDRNDRMGRSRGTHRAPYHAPSNSNDWAHPPYGSNIGYGDAGHSFGYNQPQTIYNAGGYGYGNYAGGYGELQTPSQQPWQGVQSVDWPPPAGGWGQGIQPQHQPWASQQPTGRSSSGAQQWANAQGVKSKPDNYYY